MSLRISTLVMKFISILTVYLFSTSVYADWSVDLSRRADQMSPSNSKQVPTENESVGQLKSNEKSIFSKVFDTVVPVQDIVIINTEQGFIPATVRVKEGAQYRIVVVNVNEKARNVSFVLDAFSEHHATFYGKMKSFYINPKKEGVYTFMSPETSAQGRLVVHPATGAPIAIDTEVRSPASE